MSGAAISRVMGSIQRRSQREHCHMAAAQRPAIWWVRRDFRLSDNPALRAAVDEGGPVLPLFVLDPVLLDPRGRDEGRGCGRRWRRWTLTCVASAVLG